ncbi:MAG TPA: universal stress protein [Solirubrobacteraceae bacterium]|nr:universal stress protein [Solirubrobacteraceae bacterium]
MPNIETPRSVLVAVELHDRDRGETVTTAAAYAAALGAELILAGVAPIAEPVLTNAAVALGPPSAPPVAEQQVIDRLARERLAELAAHVPDGVPARTVLNWGPLGPAIVATAEMEDAGLVVVPMRREGALGHLLHDGADRYVLHQSRVPVLVVPVEDAPA